MALSLKPAHLKRYKDLVRLFMKYGRSDIARDLTDADAETERALIANGVASDPSELADDLERMGPTFVKLGQLLSSRADLLPRPYLDAVARLQDDVKPFPYGEVKEIVEAELGVRISKAFASFDPKPLAAASLGQVHAAALRDLRPVVVKVQRPGVRQQVQADFEVLNELAAFFDDHTKIGKRYRFRKIVEEFQTSVFEELDYRREAGNLVTVAENLKDFALIHVPLPVADYSTRTVLTMDFVRGTKVTKLTPLARIDIDGDTLADNLFRAYLKQVLIDGLFHADPHPGNVFLTDDRRIALLDLGMVGRTTAGMQEQLLKLLIAFSEGNADVVLDLIVKSSDATEEFDEEEYRRRGGLVVVRQRTKAAGAVDIGTAMLEMTRISADCGLQTPSSLTLLGKTLLSPDFDPNAAVKRHASQILSERVWKGISPSNLLTPAFEMKDFVAGLPGRLNKLLDAAGNAELEIRVRSPETDHLMSAFQKIANRITTGIVLAALIVGASLLMHVDTSFRLFGYPGLAMIFFLVAAGGGLWLVFTVLIQDARDRRKARR
jgi:predicted unusual protein kinase regulating ubiquinone biosynthesis (AarF/ABC1/UbiB family)